LGEALQGNWGEGVGVEGRIWMKNGSLRVEGSVDDHRAGSRGGVPERAKSWGMGEVLRMMSESLGRDLVGTDG
jgi:hypothetical protein